MGLTSIVFSMPSIFFGNIITTHVNLFVSEGATTEYIPILSSIGKMDNILMLVMDYTISILLVRVGISMLNRIFRLLSSKILNTFADNENAVKVVFFSVENKNEYNYSKRFFYKWLNDICE